MISQCFGSITDCFYGTGEWTPNAKNFVPPAPEVPEVVLDSSNMGQEAVIVKNGSRLCGTGAARASAPIQQSKAYWEVKIQQAGKWSCGLANASCNMNEPLGNDTNSWVISHNNCIQTNSHEEYKLDQTLQEGDVLGFSYDHVELNFFLNGNNLNCPLLGIKGTVYPVLYVDDGAILDAIFEKFRSSPPSGFDRIMVEKALL